MQGGTQFPQDQLSLLERCPEGCAQEVGRLGATDVTVGFVEEFEIFWRSYPRKVGKIKAQKVWLKLKPDLETVLKALAWQTKTDQWKKDDGIYVPHPTTYLNQQRYMDANPKTIVSRVVGEKAPPCTKCKGTSWLIDEKGARMCECHPRMLTSAK